MPDWTDNKQIAIPKSHKAEANAIAEVIDPDIGGDETFTGEATHSADGTAPATHIVAHTQLRVDTYDLLAEGTPQQIADAVEADTSLSRSTLETVAEAMEIEAGYEEVLLARRDRQPDPRPGVVGLCARYRRGKSRMVGAGAGGVVCRCWHASVDDGLR